mgnify:FL=1
MKFDIAEVDLPKKMRRFLADIDSGRAHSAPVLKKMRNNVSSSLRCLVETARRSGLDEVLSAQTADAMIKRLKAANWKPSSIASQKTLLRYYAYETSEGIEWALDTVGSDRRPLALVFRGHHWAPYRVVLPMLRDEGVAERIIRLADRWLRHRAKVGQLSLDHTLQFRTDPGNLASLVRFITAIDPGNPDTRILQIARCKRLSKAKAVPRKPAYGDLPEPFLSEMKAISRKPKDLGGLSRSRIKAMGCTVRRLLRSARGQGMGEELTMKTATAFAEDLLAGDLKSISAAGYCDFLACFARHAGYPSEIYDALMQTHFALKARAKGDLKRKEIKLAKAPINLADLAKTARNILENAPYENNIRNRRRDYTLAGAIALLSKLQIRSKDLREGKIGEAFSRDSNGWQVNLTTFKTGVKINARLAECLTPYLDAVLLMDTDHEYLWTIYDQRLGTALFANPARDWKCYSAEWLRRNMTERTKHSAHIVRTLIYDYCALDADLDARVAKALVGHSHESSKKFYEINADHYRRAQALAQLSNIEKSIRA